LFTLYTIDTGINGTPLGGFVLGMECLITATAHATRHFLSIALHVGHVEVVEHVKLAMRLTGP
jgi:hypothetical protein